MQRLGLTQQLRTEQRLIQSPQMIQAMKILQCPMHDLLEQIEEELSENVFLEIVEESDGNDSNESVPSSTNATDSVNNGETLITGALSLP